MKKLYSYDIFDTCLVRTCGEPKHVFEILASNVLGKNADNSSVIDFTLIRMNAEREARNKLINEDNEEITLEDIYSFSDFSRITPIDNKTIMGMELDVEDQVLLPVNRIKTEIEQLVKKNAQIIYISDMYLPESFICKKLKQYGFYVDRNIFLSSSIKKTKSSGHLYDIVSKHFNTKNTDWLHSGDNKQSDYIIPKKRGIKSKLINHEYNQYEKMGKGIMYNGFKPNAGYPFSLSRAIRLSLPETPYNMFAATFVAPMFVSYVYEVLNDSKRRGIKHLFFVARDGYILYNIAQTFSTQFPDIRLSYLYASRQALYMAGLKELSANCIKETLPYLKNEKISRILYELHLPSYNYSGLSINGLNGEQIIDTLFEEETFIKELQSKYLEQNTVIIKYLKQEGLTEGHCATVDVVGSRRCQNALNTILDRNNYPKPFSYYFEVTWNRITDYEPYLAMNYQENVNNTKLYNRASQPLYEQFFAITNHKRTIEYRESEGKIEPIFEDDFISEEYKQKIFETNKDVCTMYARHYANECIENPTTVIQTSQRVFAYFCYAPRKEFLKAIESFRCTGSGEPNETLLNKRSLLYSILHIKQFFRWPEGQLIYSSGWLYPIVLLLLKYRYRIK